MKNKKLIIIGAGCVFIIIVGVLISFVFSNKENPEQKVVDFFSSYTKLDKDVVKKIKYPFDDELSDEQKERFISIMEKQYEQLTYNIEEKNINETDATIVVNISVNDLKEAYEKATNYVSLYQKEFASSKEIIDYKLEEIESTDIKVEYSIRFSYLKQGDKWIMNDLDNKDYLKINGVF